MANVSGIVGGEVSKARGAITPAPKAVGVGVYSPPPNRAAYITITKPVRMGLLGGGGEMVAPTGSILTVETLGVQSGKLRYRLWYTAPDGLVYTATAK